MPGMNRLSGLRSKKSLPMPSPISIPMRSGRSTRVTRAWETARRESSGRWTICFASVLRVSLKTFALFCRGLWSEHSSTSKAMRRPVTRNNGSLLRGDMGADLLALRIAPRSKHWTADPRAYVGHSRQWWPPSTWPRCRRNRDGGSYSRRRRPDCWPIWKTRRKVRFGPKISMVSATAFSGPSTVSLGNVIPLLREWNWLTRAQQEQVAEFVPKTLAANAWRSEFGTTWGPRSKREKWLRIISAVTVHPAS
jgi:hypothetical protein